MSVKKYIKTAQTALQGQTNGGIIYMFPQIILKVIPRSADVHMADRHGKRRRRGNDAYSTFDLYLYQRAAKRH